MAVPNPCPLLLLKRRSAKEAASLKFLPPRLQIIIPSLQVLRMFGRVIYHVAELPSHGFLKASHVFAKGRREHLRRGEISLIHQLEVFCRKPSAGRRDATLEL